MSKKKSAFLLDSMEAISKRAKNDTINVLLAMAKGGYYSRTSNLIESENNYKNAIVLYDKLNDAGDKSAALQNLGITQRRQGKFELAIKNTLASLRIRDSLKASPTDIATLYISVGSIYGDIENYEESNKYFKKAITIYEDQNIESYVAHLNINFGINQVKAKQFADAIETFEGSIAYYEKNGEEYYKCIAYNEIGKAYKGLENFTEAKSYYTKALDISKAINQPELEGEAIKNMGLLLVQQQAYAQALPYIQSSLKINETAGAYNNVVQDYSNLATIHADLGNFKKAYDYKVLHFRGHDSITGKENVDKINELKITYETEKKEAAIALQEEEIKTLNVQAKNDRLTKTLYGIGMFSFIAIAGLLYFGFKQRIKKNKIEREKQEAIYKQEIAFKKKELASQTLHLVQKSTFIQELRENLEKIKKSPELFKVEFRRLVLLLKKQNAEDKDWEVFKSYFSEVHNNFDQKIKRVAADISEKEIRLASFLRMNLSTKEIASMLNVLPDSVLKSKYRLKQKLQLTKEQDLTQFLNSL